MSNESAQQGKRILRLPEGRARKGKDADAKKKNYVHDQLLRKWAYDGENITIVDAATGGFARGSIDKVDAFTVTLMPDHQEAKEPVIFYKSSMACIGPTKSVEALVNS